MNTTVTQNNQAHTVLSKVAQAHPEGAGQYAAIKKNEMKLLHTDMDASPKYIHKWKLK